MISVSDSQSCTNDNNLDPDSYGRKECKRWNIFFLFLSLILGADTFITTYLLYDFASDVHATRESLCHGGFPVDCLYQLADPENPGARHSRLASCDLMIQEIQTSAHKRLRLDIRNLVWRALEEHNVTQFSKPAIHLGAKQGLNQYHHLKKTDDSEHAHPALERLNWDSTSRLSEQDGLMRLSADGEIEVPQEGTYFVYSHVHFKSTPGLDLQFMQYLFKRTAMYPQPLLLTKAAATTCPCSRSAVDLYSSQQGALFQLARGDRLSLYVHNTGAVHIPPESTYFGAFMIN